jgi:hypothetical protein
VLDFSSPIEAGNRWFELDGHPIRNMAGEHNWANVSSMGKRMAPLGAGNITRMWAGIDVSKLNTDFGARWDTDKIMTVEPSVYQRTKSGTFDLSVVNPVYLQRLESRVRAALRAGKVAIVCLFDGSLISKSWEYHAYNPKNNHQNVGPGNVDSIHTTGDWNKFQLAYVRSVVNKLKKYNNVIYETGNEFQGRDRSVPFAKMLISKLKQWTDKPVGASHIPRMGYEWMLSTNADWISPSVEPTFRPPFRGPVVDDKDHYSPLRSDPVGFRNSYLAGKVPLLMNGFDGFVLKNSGSLRPDVDIITGIVNNT